jgi:hypothetical protein
MFTLRVRDPFGCHGVSCVKLPATVAFPTDDRLLQRIEELRRGLPANNVKPLCKSRDPGWSAARPAQLVPAAQVPPKTDAERPAVDRFTARAEQRWTFSEPIRIEDVYARSRVALVPH